MDLSLSKLQETAKDRQAFRAIVYGVAKSWTRLNHWTTIIYTHTFVCVCVCVCACVSSSYPEPTDWIYSFQHIEATHPYTSFSVNSLLRKHPRDVCPGAHSVSLVWKSSIFLCSFLPAFHSGLRSSLASFPWPRLPFNFDHAYFRCHLLAFSGLCGFPSLLYMRPVFPARWKALEQVLCECLLMAVMMARGE